MADHENKAAGSTGVEEKRGGYPSGEEPVAPPVAPPGAAPGAQHKSPPDQGGSKGNGK